MVTSCGSIGLWIWVVAAFSMVPSYGMRFLGCSQRSPFMGFQQYSSPQRRRRLWPELVGGADGPHLWDCVVLLYRQRSPPMGWVAWRKCKRTPDMGCALGMSDLVLLKVTIYGSAACQEHERTPDMGRGAGMVRPDAPQRSPFMGCAACKERKRTPDVGCMLGMGPPGSLKGPLL